MTTITIPKNSIKDDLIIISRNELERLLALAKKSKSVSGKKIEQLAIEANLGKNLAGPFLSTRDLFKSLGI